MPPAIDTPTSRSTHDGSPAEPVNGDERPRSALDEALEETFPASDPVAATAAADGDDDDRDGPAGSPRRSGRADREGATTRRRRAGTTVTDDAGETEDGDAPSASARRAPAHDDGIVHFPTSRRAGAGTSDDDRPTLNLRANAVQMLQADHAHLFLTTQKFKPRLSFDRKRAIVDTVCISLEIHLQLKEEIFYPALSRVIARDDETLARALDAIEPLRAEIAQLRSLRPWDDEFDERFMGLMKEVLHGIADEETVLLPIAQSRMADQLDTLGTQMSHRRMQLMGPHLAALTINTMRTLPLGGLLAGAGAFAGGLLLARSLMTRRG